MNQKKARALRIFARHMQTLGAIPEGPWAVYGHVDHKKTVPHFVKQEDGTEKEEKRDIITRTVVLDPKCPKAVYHRAKRFGIKNILATS